MWRIAATWCLSGAELFRLQRSFKDANCSLEQNSSWQRLRSECCEFGECHGSIEEVVGEERVESYFHVDNCTDQPDTVNRLRLGDCVSYRGSYSIFTLLEAASYRSAMYEDPNCSSLQETSFQPLGICMDTGARSFMFLCEEHKIMRYQYLEAACEGNGFISEEATLDECWSLEGSKGLVHGMATSNHTTCAASTTAGTSTTSTTESVNSTSRDGQIVVSLTRGSQSLAIIGFSLAVLS